MNPFDKRKIKIEAVLKLLEITKYANIKTHILLIKKTYTITFCLSHLSAAKPPIGAESTLANAPAPQERLVKNLD